MQLRKIAISLDRPQFNDRLDDLKDVFSAFSSTTNKGVLTFED